MTTALAKGGEFKEGTAMHIPKAKMPVAGELDEESAEFKELLKQHTLHQFSDKDTDDE